MKRFPLLAVLALSAAAWCADPTLVGTKQDLVLPKSEAPAMVNGMQLVQMIVALAVVIFLLKWGLPKVLGKINSRLTTSVGSSIRVEESASFAAGNLYVVSVRGKTLLLSASPQGVSCLADITEDKAAKKEEPAFFEMLDAAKQADEPARAAVRMEAETPRPDVDDVQAALDRLSRLTG